ncbi:hypothetical protein MKEN_00277300 [Mycena kentingensis (nom. inval.)]|nr:hypothetical protein MKEN_00277300 [Mycena kentingensis (nom. inval.)]
MANAIADRLRLLREQKLTQNNPPPPPPIQHQISDPTFSRREKRPRVDEYDVESFASQPSPLDSGSDYNPNFDPRLVSAQNAFFAPSSSSSSSHNHRTGNFLIPRQTTSMHSNAPASSKSTQSYRSESPFYGSDRSGSLVASRTSISSSGFGAPAAPRKSSAARVSAEHNELANLLSRVAAIEAGQQEHEKVVEEVGTLREQVDVLHERVGELETRSNEHEHVLAKLQAGQPLTASETKVAEDTMTNAQKGALRAVLYSMMGTLKSEDLPAPRRNVPPNENAYWISQPGEPKALLRPDWDKPWSANASAWFNDYFTVLQQRGSEIYTDCTAAELEALTKEKVAKQMQFTTFRNLKERWKLEQKPEQQKKNDKQGDRVEKRQQAKLKRRLPMREEYPALKGPQYDALFALEAQSSDHTDPNASDSAPPSDEPISDSGAEGEKKPKTKKKKKTKQKKLVTHQPESRSSEARKFYDDLDTRSWARREQAKKGKSGAQAKKELRARRSNVLASVDDLPHLKAGKFTPSMIAQEWLFALPEQKILEMAESWVYGEEDDGYDASWSVFPMYDAYDADAEAEPAKKKQAGERQGKGVDCTVLFLDHNIL